MKLPRRRFLHLAAGAATLPAVSRIAWAQAYPSRPVRIIARTAPVSRVEWFSFTTLLGFWTLETAALCRALSFLSR